MTITQVTGLNIKGLDFVQDIDQLTLFIGANGAGKSARSQALILALTGYIPGGGKQNADILDSYGSDDKMVVGVAINNTLFERGFVRTGSTVGQGYKVNGKKVTKEQFAQAMGEAGRPVAIDIGAFMALSDQKKIDAVMDLYPPETDISQIVTEIEATKAAINTLTAKAKSTEDAAARLTTARAAIEMPVGTLADVHGQILDTEAQLQRARQDLADAEAEELRQRTITEEKEKSDKAVEAAKSKAAEDARRELLKQQAEQLKTADSGESKTLYHKPVEVVSLPDGDPAVSLHAILDALNGAGCTACAACAARLVAIRELRKYAKKEAA